MSRARIVYMFLGTARSGTESTGYARGEHHAVIALALAAQRAEAEELAVAHFQSSGWQPVLEQGAVLEPERLSAEAPEVVRAYEDCLQHGTAGIVFADPLDEEPAA